jgi:hypothetical protein
MECKYQITYMTSDDEEILLIEALISKYDGIYGKIHIGLGTSLVTDYDLLKSLRPHLRKAKDNAIEDARQNDNTKGTDRLLKEVTCEVI